MIMLPYDIHIERLAVNVLESGVFHVKTLVDRNVSKSIFFNCSNFAPKDTKVFQMKVLDEAGLEYFVFRSNVH